jgi:hypothetical protein
MLSPGVDPFGSTVIGKILYAVLCGYVDIGDNNDDRQRLLKNSLFPARPAGGKFLGRYSILKTLRTAISNTEQGILNDEDIGYLFDHRSSSSSDAVVIF